MRFLVVALCLALCCPAFAEEPSLTPSGGESAATADTAFLLYKEGKKEGVIQLWVDREGVSAFFLVALSEYSCPDLSPAGRALGYDIWNATEEDLELGLPMVVLEERSSSEEWIFFALRYTDWSELGHFWLKLQQTGVMRDGRYLLLYKRGSKMDKALWLLPRAARYIPFNLPPKGGRSPKAAPMAAR